MRQIPFRPLTAPVLAIVLIMALSASQCDVSHVVTWANRVGNAAQEAKPVVQSLIDGGVLHGEGAAILSRLDEVAADAKTIADAYASGNTNGAVEATAKAITVFETLINQDAQLIPAKQRTIVLAILAAADIALHSISDELIKQGKAHHVQAKGSAADTIRKFAKKPQFRCKDATTGKFVKTERCKTDPDHTEMVRIDKVK